MSLAFAFLSIGYLGIKGVYDSSENNTAPAGSGALFTLVLFELLSGVGSNAGFSAALNAVAKSFPSKIVSVGFRSVAIVTLTMFLDTESDHDRDRNIWLWIICLPFFYHRTYRLPRKHFWSLAHSSGRDGRSDDHWLVLDSPLPISRSRGANGRREWRP